jgi:hypothetical protein
MEGNSGAADAQISTGGGVAAGGTVGGVSILTPLPTVPEAGPTPVADIANVREIDWSPARSRERMRSFLAAGLVGLLAFITLIPFVLLVTGSVPIAELDTLMKIVFAPVVALVGSVVGFYFGAEVASRGGQPPGGSP